MATDAASEEVLFEAGRIDDRLTGAEGAERSAELAAQVATTPTSRPAAATSATREAGQPAVDGDDVPGRAPPATASSRSNRASPMALSRFPWISFSRQRWSKRTTDAGRLAGSRLQSGSSFITEAMTSDEVAAEGWSPVIISNSTTPNAHTSARRSADLPFACSGDMAAAVPRIRPIGRAPGHGRRRRRSSA